EAIRQHMDQKAADELSAVERHRFLPVAVTIVLPAEADLAVVDRQQSIVGDGDAVRVAADVLQHLCRTGERALGVDYPVGGIQWRKVAAERCRLLEMLLRVEEAQLPGVKRLLQVAQEQPAEQPRENPDWKKEAGPAGDPALAVRCNPTTRHQAVQVRMVTPTPTIP